MQRGFDALQRLANPLGCCLILHERRKVHIALGTVPLDLMAAFHAELGHCL